MTKKNKPLHTHTHTLHTFTMEQFNTEQLPQHRHLPAELPAGGLNGGGHLLGTGSTQHFNWHKHVAPNMWEFGTTHGVKHVYSGTGLDHQDAMFAKDKIDHKMMDMLKLSDSENGRDSAEVWEATQEHVWGLRRVRELPFAPVVSRQVVGDETGIDEGGFDQINRKTTREKELQGSRYNPDANTISDGRVAAWNRPDDSEDMIPSIQGGDTITALPQNERTAVKVV